MSIDADLHPTRWISSRPYSAKVIALHKNISMLQHGDIQGHFERIYGEIIRGYNDEIMKVPVSERPANAYFVQEEANLSACVAQYLSAGRNAFRITPALAQSLEHTSLDGVRCGELEFPFHNFYVSLLGHMRDGLAGESRNVVEGAYVSTHEGMIVVTLTTRKTDEHGIPLARYPVFQDRCFAVPLDTSDPDASIEDALLSAIAKGDIDIDDSVDGPDVDMDTTGLNIHRAIDVSARSNAERARNRAESLPVVRRALALIVNFCVWTTTDQAELQEPGRWQADAPRELLRRARVGRTEAIRREAVSRLVREGYSRIRMVGQELQRRVDEDRRSEPSGREMPPHWRIGHYQKVYYGPRDAEPRPFRRVWIEAIKVRSDLGEPANAHLYVAGMGDAVTVAEEHQGINGLAP